MLKREGIQPSEISEDTEFLRRAHLDMTGRIPTPEEVLDFLKDGSSTKRQKKIEELLASEDYLDYWSGMPWQKICHITSSFRNSSLPMVNYGTTAQETISYVTSVHLFY